MHKMCIMKETPDGSLRLEDGFFWGALFWCSVLNSRQNWKHRGWYMYRVVLQNHQNSFCFFSFSKTFIICLGRYYNDVSFFQNGLTVSALSLYLPETFYHNRLFYRTLLCLQFSSPFTPQNALLLDEVAVQLRQ